MGSKMAVHRLTALREVPLRTIAKEDPVRPPACIALYDNHRPAAKAIPDFNGWQSVRGVPPAWKGLDTAGLVGHVRSAVRSRAEPGRDATSMMVWVSGS